MPGGSPSGGPAAEEATWGPGDGAGSAQGPWQPSPGSCSRTASPPQLHSPADRPGRKVRRSRGWQLSFSFRHSSALSSWDHGCRGATRAALEVLERKHLHDEVYGRYQPRVPSTMIFFFNTFTARVKIKGIPSLPEDFLTPFPTQAPAEVTTALPSRKCQLAVPGLELCTKRSVTGYEPLSSGFFRPTGHGPCVMFHDGQSARFYC